MVKWGGTEETLNLENRDALELNINHYVLVSLTEDWKNILKKYFLDLLKDYVFYKAEGYSSLEEYVEEEQLPIYYKDGYFKIQLRELMNIFWNSIWRSNVFKDNKIYFIESNSDFDAFAKQVSWKMKARLLKALE